MSSFIINKVEYIKAAGLMYGIEDAKLHKHEYFLNHVRYYFVNCYKANVKSVCLQYEEEREEDKNEYMGVFERYKIKGGQLVVGNGNGDCRNVEEFRLKLMEFFQSVLYQIEDQDLNEYVSHVCLMCINKLFEKDIEDSKWWGAIGI